MNKPLEIYVVDRLDMPCHLATVHVYFDVGHTDFDEDEAKEYKATTEAQFKKQLSDNVDAQIVLVCITDKEAKKYPSAKAMLGFKCLAKWRTMGGEGLVTDMIFKV